MCAAVIRSTGEWDFHGWILPDGVEPPPHLAVVGHDHDLPRVRAQIGAAFVGIGEGAIRARLMANLEQLGYQMPAIIAPSAVLDPSVVVGDGALVSPGALINVGARIGKGAIINTGAVVEHHVRVGDFAHVAPNATLCGSVTVEGLALVGAGSVVLPDRRVGKGAIVAAGSAAARDVPAGSISGLPRRGISK
jgi:sugar O-acyltransferase (sialic acid O-acetyltransferase NeuD family)